MSRVDLIYEYIESTRKSLQEKSSRKGKFKNSVTFEKDLAP